MTTIIRLLLAGALCCGVVAARAEAPRAESPQRAIPYRTEPASLEDQGLRTLAALVALLVAAGAGLALLHKRMPGGLRFPLVSGGGRLRLIERLRLNARCTLYVVELDHREVLLAHCGDRVVQVETRSGSSLPAGEPDVHA